MRGFGSTRGALAALAFACAASVWLHLTGERAISGSSAVLGSLAYDMQSVVAPAASGPLLTALTYLLTATPLGPPIRRFLLNDNKVEILRELAAQSNNTPPLYYPMRRVDAAVHEAHAAAFRLRSDQFVPRLARRVDGDNILEAVHPQYLRGDAGART